MSGDNASSADNQQETLYYLCGLMVGEGSISIIRATNQKGGVSNSQFNLLKMINEKVAEKSGVITRIKGGHNLSIRGKGKVQKIISFFDRYPPVCGDIFKKRFYILKTAIDILNKKGRRNKRIDDEERIIEVLRARLRMIKDQGRAKEHFSETRLSKKKIGYFLAGIVDAEGSMGFRRSGIKLQPYYFSHTFV